MRSHGLRPTTLSTASATRRLSDALAVAAVAACPSRSLAAWTRDAVAIAWTARRALPSPLRAPRPSPPMARSCPTRCCRSAARVQPAGGPLCPGSLRPRARERTLLRRLVGVGRTAAPCSTCRASADSGRLGERPAAVDTSDVSSRGCRRPPPSVADGRGERRVCRLLDGARGHGRVLRAHHGAVMLHSPVAVIYGERLVATAIAAERRSRGGRVRGAERHAPADRRRDLADQGHIFETHTTASRRQWHRVASTSRARGADARRRVGAARRRRDAPARTSSCASAG